MNPCNNCIVDMICIKECPNFELDLGRLQTDDMMYLTRCINNHPSPRSYSLSDNIRIDIRAEVVEWYKDGQCHRDNDKPAVIWHNGARYWYKNGRRHRDNDKPATIKSDGTEEFWKGGRTRSELSFERKCTISIICVKLIWWGIVFKYVL